MGNKETTGENKDYASPIARDPAREKIREMRMEWTSVQYHHA